MAPKGFAKCEQVKTLPALGSDEVTNIDNIQVWDASKGETTDNFPSLSWHQRAKEFAKPDITRHLFPGSLPFDKERRLGIDYERLNKKQAERDPGYEAMPDNVEHYKLETILGTKVGLHVYPAKVKDEMVQVVVIFCHGNIRPSRYMHPFLKHLHGQDDCVVIARDFVGYDLSSRLSNNSGGRLELAAVINDQAVYNLALEQYPKATIVVVGRSIGSLGCANLVSCPKVQRILDIVPFAEVESVIRKAFIPGALKKSWPNFTDFVGRVITFVMFNSFFGSVYPEVKRVFQVDEEHSRLTIETHGFSALRTIKSCENLGPKECLILRAMGDKLVPNNDAKHIQEQLKEKSVDVHIVDMEGDHATLPIPIPESSRDEARPESAADKARREKQESILDCLRKFLRADLNAVREIEQAFPAQRREIAS